MISEEINIRIEIAHHLMYLGFFFAMLYSIASVSDKYVECAIAWQLGEDNITYKLVELDYYVSCIVTPEGGVIIPKL